MTIQITSPAFPYGTAIPRRYTCDGDDVSPALEWSGVPAEAQVLVLIMDDPDAPRGTWSHWVQFNIPPTVAAIAEGVTADTQPEGLGVSGRNSSGKHGYGGPCPPRGPKHRYYFTLYALDAPLKLRTGSVREEVIQAMQGHIVAQGQWMGVYERAS